jgi:hypothetical protein
VLDEHGDECPAQVVIPARKSSQESEVGPRNHGSFHFHRNNRSATFGFASGGLLGRPIANWPISTLAGRTGSLIAE